MNKLFTLLVTAIAAFTGFHCDLKTVDPFYESTISEAVTCMQRLDINNFKFMYSIEGKGIPCIVYGPAINYRRALSCNLRKHFKFIFLDPRWSAEPKSNNNLNDFKMEDVISDIEKARKTLRLGKIALLGHSIHANYVLEYAKHYPQNVSHVIMVCGTPKGPEMVYQVQEQFWNDSATEERKSAFEQSWNTFTALDTANLTDGEIMAHEEVAWCPWAWKDPYYNSYWFWKNNNCNRKMIDHVYELFIPYDFIQTVQTIRIPVFVAYGKYDFLIPYTLWTPVLCQCPSVSFNRFDESGHYPMLEQQELFDKKLLKWIKNN